MLRDFSRHFKSKRAPGLTDPVTPMDSMLSEGIFPFEDQSMAKSKSRAKKRKAAPDKDHDLIVIDEKAGLIFENERDLSAYFEPAIQALEAEYQSLRAEKDFNDEEQLALEGNLEATLDEPDEVWQDDKTLGEVPLHIFIKNLGEMHYVAVAYISTEDGEPTFVLTHFPTRDPQLLDNYRRGEQVYDAVVEGVQPAAIDGDALGDGDPLAIGLYTSMMKVRGDKDIPEADFQKFGGLREDTIENADEIWRKNDLEGNVLVCFIREYPDHELVKDLTYVVLTVEDESANMHALLFSFPTTDKTLVDRYRQGENLQAEEVVQESSH